MKPKFAVEVSREKVDGETCVTFDVKFDVKPDAPEEWYSLVIKNKPGKDILTYCVDEGEEITCHRNSWPNALLEATHKCSLYYTIPRKEFELCEDTAGYWYALSQESTKEIWEEQASIGQYRPGFMSATPNIAGPKYAHDPMPVMGPSI